MALLTLIANARYLLMSCALSQRLRPDMPIYHRLIIGFDITDELFGLAINRPGMLEPPYYYGAMIMAMPMWALGTALGVLAGSVLPAALVSALSVALYAMFLATIIPQARKDRVVRVLVPTCFALSLAFSRLPRAENVIRGHTYHRADDRCFGRRGTALPQKGGAQCLTCCFIFWWRQALPMPCACCR